MTAQARPPALTAQITGASSGIGEALAGCFAAGGCNLVLVARSAGKLDALARKLSAEHGVRARAVACDLAQPGAAAALAARMRRSRRPIDILVNNAGVLEFGPFVVRSSSCPACWWPAPRRSPPKATPPAWPARWSAFPARSTAPRRSPAAQRRAG